MDNALVFEKLQWRPVAQCLMRSDAVVDVVPMTKFFIEFRHSPRTIIDLIELLRMGSLCPLYTPIKLWTLWRQYE
jgi:hypothetical protein